jgi:TonB family protein
MDAVLRKAASLAFCVSLVAPCLAADNPDLALFTVEEFSYRGAKVEGCDKNVTLRFGESFAIMAPIEGTIFTTKIVPHLDEGAVRFDIVVTGRPAEPASMDESDSLAGQSEDSPHSDEPTLLSEETVVIPDHTSKRLVFGDIGFRLFNPAPKMLSIPDAATIKDDQGAEVRGSVILAARILEDGNVKRVAIMHSDDERLNEEAQNVMLRAKYAPPTMDGKPYSLVVHHRFEF